jgi:hypothetical protein
VLFRSGTGNGWAISSGYVDLEDGVQVQFDLTGTYRTGDYWLIPARTVPGKYGDIEWPKDGKGNPLALAPVGVQHHYCRLGVITARDLEGQVTFSIEDCRIKFPPLTELTAGGGSSCCCCSVSVGHGGDYPDLRSALAARPAEAAWWTIRVMPGVHSLSHTLAIERAENLTFGGCGPQSRIVGPAGKPAFTFTNCKEIKLEGLKIEASSPAGAILFTTTGDITVANLAVTNLGRATGTTKPQVINVFGPVGPVIVLDTCSQVEILENNLRGLPAITANGEDFTILHNRIVGGGVQIIPPSRDIRIQDNWIYQGMGPGIQLGGGNKTTADLVKMIKPMFAAVNSSEIDSLIKIRQNPGNVLASIRGIEISRNLIGKMAGSGIVTQMEPEKTGVLGDVEDLTIQDNQIISCCRNPDVILSKRARVGGGIAALGLFNTRITDNFIADNGLGSQAACGIFIQDGSDIDISGNVVVENGTLDNQAEPEAYQAGIAAQYIHGDYITTSLNKMKAGTDAGNPAIRILDNKVVCAAGQALTILAMGSVMVDGNTLVTRERKKQPAFPLAFFEKAACVSVFDLGLPIWFPDSALNLLMLSNEDTTLHLGDDQPLDPLSGQIPDGHILFHNNQVSFNTDQEEKVQALGQVTSQWPMQIWAAATFSALFFSLDDISLAGNQFRSTVPAYEQIGREVIKKMNKATSLDISTCLYAHQLKFIDVSTLAPVVRAVGNGLSERLRSNWCSYASLAGVMSLTSDNEATHNFATFAPQAKQDNNISLKTS